MIRETAFDHRVGNLTSLQRKQTRFYAGCNACRMVSEIIFTSVI
jgi:hypothetical protein